MNVEDREEEDEDIQEVDISRLVEIIVVLINICCIYVKDSSSGLRP